MSNYAKIKTFNTANGDGIRTSIFFCGCDFNCPNCFNKELQDPNYGNEFTTKTKKEIWSSMGSHIAGISILGGEPLSQYNLETVTKLCKEFKQDFSDKTIWLWTGKIFGEVRELEIMNYIDVLVDGPFVEALKVPNLKFRGSTNQRIIDVQETIRKNILTELS